MSIQNTQSISGGLPQTGGYVTPQASVPQPKSSVEKPKTEVKPIGADSLQTAVDEANRVFEETRTDIRFVIESESKKVVIKLVEPSSGKTINQYPSEQAVAISNAIAQSQLQATERYAAYKSSGANLLGLFVKQSL